jgi:glycine/D-amino acid oxidase-like deaminating enzyme
MLNIDKISYWEQKQYFDSIDYLIIGAGIVGYSTAIYLREKNPEAKILIIERGILSSGASSKNAGFACFGSPTEIIDDIKNFGEDVVMKTLVQRKKGLERLVNLLGSDTISLEINGSWDLIKESEHSIYEDVNNQLDYLNALVERHTGESDIYSFDAEVSQRFGLKGILGGFYNRLEGQIDTSKLNHAFYKKAIAKDIDVLFGIEAKEIIEEQEKIHLKTNFGTISAHNVAICTNGFATQFLPKEDINPARAQVLITKPIPELKLKGTFHYQKGYYYFRNIDNRILLGGGRNLDFEGETTTELKNTELIIDSLKKLLADVILPSTPIEIERTWSGIMGVGNTKKPIIKKVGTNIYCGVRLGGMGVAIGTIVGEELADLMLGKN